MIKKLAAIMTVAIAPSLIGCNCEDCSCDEVHQVEQKLAKCQKKVGNFKLGKSTHYVHSDGFELDLKVTQDTTFKENNGDYCSEFITEIRNIELTSTYPVLSVNVQFSGGYTFTDDKTKQSVNPLLISYNGTSYSINLDDSGIPMSFDTKKPIKMLDTITFNGVTYDSVFVILDNRYDNNNLPKNEKAVNLYFSRTKGILKLETIDKKSFTIKEGDTNE